MKSATQRRKARAARGRAKRYADQQDLINGLFSQPFWIDLWDGYTRDGYRGSAVTITPAPEEKNNADDR